MENSPPGIQTIREGAGPDAEVELLVVVAKVIEVASGEDALELAKGAAVCSGL